MDYYDSELDRRNGKTPIKTECQILKNLFLHFLPRLSLWKRGAVWKKGSLAGIENVKFFQNTEETAENSENGAHEIAACSGVLEQCTDVKIRRLLYCVVYAKHISEHCYTCIIELTVQNGNQHKIRRSFKGKLLWKCTNSINSIQLRFAT
jgi:hypothetical protein